MTIFINKELNGIEVAFESKPAQEVIDSLKNNGFRWHRAKKLWYAKNTAERLALAESIANEKAETSEKVKKSTTLPSLWERCKTDNIPEHCSTTDTKTVAAETRKHIKKRFPEIKFSCRIGSGGWASANEVNFYFKSAPFAEDSVYFKAVEKYVKAWLWSFNYDNSDSMTDYFDRNFYENISTWDFTETEPTEAQKADLANFDAENQKAKDEEERQREEEYKKYLEEQEEKEKAYKKRQEIEEAQKAEIINHVKVVDISENKRYIISGYMICGIGKECSIEEIQNEGTGKEESALVKRELHFTDEKIYNNFCNMFLHDFDFLSGFGGTGTFDERVTDENYRQLSVKQRESIKWILWDCVAVFLNGEMKLVINPEGYDYARYVNILSGEYEKTMPYEKEQEANEEKAKQIETPENAQPQKPQEAKVENMIIKFRAFAEMENEKGKSWRVNISNYNTEEEAKKAAEKFAEKYKDGNAKAVYVGVHKYYIISRKEWEKLTYTDVSIKDGKTKTWMANEGLLFEGVHFEIA